MFKAIVYSSLLLNIGLLLGRFSGFLRESLLAGNFGVSAHADVAVLMLSVPDLMVNILVGGGLAAALVPEFGETKLDSRRLWGQALLLFTLIFTLLTSVIVIFIEPLMQLLVPGFNDSQLQISLKPMRYVMWLVPMTVATGVMAAYLQAYNRFGAAALGTLVINAVIITGLFFISFFDGSLIMLAMFVLLGGLIRFIAQYITAARVAGNPQLSIVPWIVDKALIVRFVQVAGAGSILLCFPVVIRAFASYAGEGGVAQINYAMKLVELPLAITVTFLSTVLFPRLSRAYKEDSVLYQQLIIWGTRATLFLSLISVAALVPVSVPLAQLVYGHGSMQEQDVIQIASLLSTGLLYIPFLGMATFVTVVLNAQKDAKTPLWISITAFMVLLVSAWSTGHADLSMLIKILVLAYAVAGVVSFCALLIKFPTLCRGIFSLGYMCLILCLPVGLYWLLQVLLTEPNTIMDLMIAFLLAGIGCVIGILTLPVVRKKLKSKLQSL